MSLKSEICMSLAVLPAGIKLPKSLTFFFFNGSLLFKYAMILSQNALSLFLSFPKLFWSLESHVFVHAAFIVPWSTQELVKEN